MAAHAKTPLGQLEYRIALDHGFDLYDVKRWPVEKKLAYQEHIVAHQIAQQQAGEGEMGGMGGLDGQLGKMPSPPTGSMPSTPAGAASAARSMKSNAGMTQQSPSVGKVGPVSGREIHPALRQYGNIVHVTGDEDEE